jgi:hypothetical protein
MLTKGQLAHFDTFGFLVLRQAFSPAEMKACTEAAEEIWAVDDGNSAGSGENSGATSVSAIVADKRGQTLISD